MRSSAIAACILLVGIILCGFQQGTPAKAKKDNGNEGQQTRNPTQNSGPVAPGQRSPGPSKDNPNRDQATNSNNIYITGSEKQVDLVERGISIFGAVCTLVLAIVGIVGICFGRQTLRAIQRERLIMIKQTRLFQRQTKATEDAAKAALLNARVMIRAERALIEVDLGTPSTHIDEFGEEIIGAVANDFFRYGILIKNHGRTVARVKSYKVWSDCFAKDFQRDKFNRATEITKQIFLAANRAETIGDIDFGKLFDEADWESIHAKTKTGMLRIDVHYEDIVRNKRSARAHETSVIFRYDLEEEELKILPQYTSTA